MTHIDLLEEAEDCRRRALAYVGQPEAAFLLKVAKTFEELNAKTGAASAAWPLPPREDARSDPRRPFIRRD